MQMTDIEIITSYQQLGCLKAQITILVQLNGCNIKRILGKKILCCVTPQQRTQIEKFQLNLTTKVEECQDGKNTFSKSS